MPSVQDLQIKASETSVQVNVKTVPRTSNKEAEIIAELRPMILANLPPAGQTITLETLWKCIQRDHINAHRRPWRTLSFHDLLTACRRMKLKVTLNPPGANWLTYEPAGGENIGQPE